MSLAKQYNPKETEERVYSFWLKNNAFSASVQDKKIPFCIVIPPPNITGILHMGHALNNTIQDVLIRFKRMQEYESLWMPGTDHAGIATQNVVEKQLAREGLTKEDIGRKEFTRRLWEWREKYGSTIIEQLKKLGASCDWGRTRFTMDEEYSEAVKEVFVHLYNKGLIYRGNYIINWCPRCKTALSDEEAPYSEVDGYLYYIRYPLKGEEGRFVTVATTRPETMLGDTAVAINPEDSRYQWLKGKEVILPLMNRTLRVIEDELIEADFGTGVVKVTPAHDPVDFVLAQKHNLEFINIMNDDATMNENAGRFSGLDRFKARQEVLEALEREGFLEKKDPYRIRAGHCYRCNTLIEPRLSRQWFVKMKPLAEAAIKVVEEDKVKFYPPRWKKVYLNWMYNIQDWCISRQIWWGHQLPVFYCQSCLQKKGDVFSSSGSESKGVIVTKVKPDKCPVCGSTDIVQEQDVLDTWFSSWLWPFATFYWPFPEKEGKTWEKEKAELSYFYPTNTLVTASEILFFWVARMIMAGLEFMGEIPFRDVLIHGTVRDAKGIKMSKSLGNIIDPLDVIAKFGADALRFSLMMLAATGSDVYLSDEKFLVGRNFANKIWNASRFILQKIEEERVEVTSDLPDELDDIDIWILKQLNFTIRDVTENLERYRINDATKRIYDFFWHNFCDWYIEITKSSFTETRAKVLVYCLKESLKLLHPVMPFITEDIFQKMREKGFIVQEESIIRSRWPSPVTVEDRQEEASFVEELINLVRELRNLKMDIGIPPGERIRALISTDKFTQEGILAHKEWVIRMANLGDIEFRGELSRVLLKTEKVSCDFVIKDIDVERYINAIEKKIAKKEAFLEKVAVKLNNANFLEKASPEVVQEQREKKEVLSGEIKRLRRIKDAFAGKV